MPKNMDGMSATTGQQYVHVRKIIKSNFKELKFRTDDKKTVHIKGMQGLRYKIEDE